MQDIHYINRVVSRGSALQYIVNRAGCGMVSPNFDIKRNSAYPYCVIHYVAAGHGFVVHRNVKYGLKPGSLFILGPYEAHHYACDPGSPFNLNWVEFSGGDSGKYINQIITNLTPVLEEGPAAMINDYLLGILAKVTEDPEKNALKISELLYSILLNLYDKSSKKAYSDLNARSLSDFSRVEAYINDHLNEDLSIERLAATASFSPTYFARLFHRVMGMTPARYVLEKRLNKAKELLAGDTVKIELVSEQLGFCNTSHFIKTFRKAEGLTPAEYRHQSVQFRQDFRQETI